jgi:hypothetical protein
MQIVEKRAVSGSFTQLTLSLPIRMLPDPVSSDCWKLVAGSWQLFSLCYHRFPSE